jgi:hypothetical protein
MIHLHDLGGFWRRTLIAWPDGRSDRDTEVFWVQGPSLYADLRIPAGPPLIPYARCLRDLDWAMLRFMAHQEGFFGRFDVINDVGQWQRAFDYQPDNGVMDRGALAFEDGILVERGIDVAYVEHWARRACNGAAVALALKTTGGVAGCLVAAGDAFIYARGRTAALPHGATLSTLIDNAVSLQAAQDLVDCEISFGRRHGGDWRIERSSHCYREGADLAPAFDGPAGTLVVNDLTAGGGPMRRTWRIVSVETSNDTPLPRWFGGGKGAASTGPASGAADKTLEASL